MRTVEQTSTIDTAFAKHTSTMRRRLSTQALAAAVVAVAAIGAAAAPAAASVTCDPASDVCVVTPDVVQTPLGPVTVSTSPTNVVTVHLDPADRNTWVIGVPFALPSGVPVSGCPGGCGRTAIDTPGGLVTIDTITPPPGLPTRFSLPSVAIISIHPPSPCRVRTVGTTVTFTPVTPVIPPGPPA